MYTRLTSLLTDHIVNIDTLVTHNYLKNNIRNYWKPSEELKNRISDYKSNFATVSNSCVKAALLVEKSSDVIIMTDILEEILNTCNILFSIYTYFTDNIDDSIIVCSCLFNSISSAYRGFLFHVKDLIINLSDSKKHKSVNYTAGMVTKLNEQIQNLPLTNKIACRRYIMERISVVKETMTEFDNLLKVSKDSKTDNDTNVFLYY